MVACFLGDSTEAGQPAIASASCREMTSDIEARVGTYDLTGSTGEVYPGRMSTHLIVTASRLHVVSRASSKADRRVNA